MKKMELDSKFSQVTTGSVDINGFKYNTFKLVENERYIDLNNLQNYTIKQLISIYGYPIRGAKKADYINFILKNKSNEIKSENRSVILKNLGI
jgi:hypothetical protein